MVGCPLTLLITSANTLPAVVALGGVLLTGGFYIQQLRRLALGQFIREDGPQSHHKKAGTPTGGGFLLLLMWGLSLFSLLGVWSREFFQQQAGWLLALLVVGWGLSVLGLWDDALKILKRHNKGVTGYTKLGVQAGLSLLVAAVPFLWGFSTQQSVFGANLWQPGWFWWPFVAFAVTGASNAVNLTDGLDGLAASSLLVSFATLALWLWQGWAVAPSPLLLPATLALAAVCLGFLAFNKHPAKLFMGDSGSLAFGGVLAALALWSGQGLWLAFLGFLFAVETLSVMLQVVWFKRTGKRLFKMAPLHHHFELLGWHEQKVVKVFVAIQVLVCVLASLLKASFYL